MLLSIIIPVYNEANLVCELLKKVATLRLDSGLEKELVVIDDGSSDATYAVIEAFIAQHSETEIRLLRHTANQGKGAGIRTGLKAARGDIFIIQDADLEYDPEDIREVVRPIFSGLGKVVYGSRILREKELGRSGAFGLFTGKHPNSYLLAYLGGVAITKFVNLLQGSKLTDEPTCYKCFHREALEGISIESDDFAWEPEVTVKLLKNGHSIQEVPISYHPRKRGEGKKINWKDGVIALWTVWKHSQV